MLIGKGLKGFPLKGVGGLRGYAGISLPSVSLASSAFILFSAQGAKNQGFLNWDRIDALPYEGSNPDGVGVSQATEADQPFMRIAPSYNEDGFDSSAANEMLNNGQGIESEGSATNKHTNYNIAPTDLTGITVSLAASPGASVVNISDEGLDDSLFGASNDNGKIYKIDNSGNAGNAQYFINGDTGNTNTHSFQLVAQSANGDAETKFGLSTSFIGEVLAPTTMQKLKGENITPSGAGNKVFFRVGPGDTLYFKYNQLEESTVCSSLVDVSGSSATRSAGSITSNTNTAYIDKAPDFTGSAGNISLVGSKYETLGAAEWVDARYVNADGSQSFCTAFVNSDTLTWSGDISAGGILIFTDSGYAGNAAAMELLRSNAGDGASWSTLDNDFTYEWRGTLTSVPTNGVIYQSGNYGVFYDGANIVFDVGGTNTSVAVADPTTIEFMQTRWDGANLQLRVNETSATPVASASPVLETYFSHLVNNGGINSVNGFIGSFKAFDGATLECNFTPENDGSGAYAYIEDDTSNDYVMTNETLSPKNDVTFTKTGEDCFIEYESGDSLWADSDPAGNWYGGITVADLIYNSADVGSGISTVQGANGLLSVAKEDGTGKLEFLLAEITVDPVTTTTVFSDTRYTSSGGSGGDNINAYSCVSVDVNIEDDSSNASAAWPQAIVAFTPENRQKVYKFGFIPLPDPIESQDDINQLALLFEGQL